MEVTDLLKRVGSGDAIALNDVMPLVYDELKKLANVHLRREGPIALEATSLVHEAFLRLVGSAHPSYENRAHFYGIASRMMRHILIDLARARRAQKRDSAATVYIAELRELGTDPPDDMLFALDDALSRLAREHPRKAQLIEMRYFGGMTAEDSAAVLSVSVHTVRRELRFAQAWLHRELAP